MATETLEQTVARLYAGMTPEQIEAHEDWVRRFHASDAGKALAASRAQQGLVSQLAEMTDREVLAVVVAIVQRGAGLDAGLEYLRDAGFERNV